MKKLIKLISFLVALATTCVVAAQNPPITIPIPDHDGNDTPIMRSTPIISCTVETSLSVLYFTFNQNLGNVFIEFKNLTEGESYSMSAVGSGSTTMPVSFSDSVCLYSITVTCEDGQVLSSQFTL